MATFGENLRRERELRGITLAELAEATRISTRYLAALENNHFDRLPGGIFNRGFVRAVANYLGLDLHEWVGAYIHAAKEEPEVLALYAPAAPARKISHPAWMRTALVVILFVAGLFAVHSVRTRKTAETTSALPSLPPNSSPTAPAHPRTNPTPVVPAAALSATQLPLPVPAVNSAPEPSVAESNGVDLHLQVFAVEETWVSVSADGQNLYEGLMKPRETRVFRAAQELSVRTGNASALVLTLNGETLAPLGNPGEVKTVTLSRKDLASSRQP